MKIERGTVTLSTGKEFSVDCLTPLSLAETGGRYDEPVPFTTAERREIAEYMVARWAAWGDLKKGNER